MLSTTSSASMSIKASRSPLSQATTYRSSKSRLAAGRVRAGVRFGCCRRVARARWCALLTLAARLELHRDFGDAQANDVAHRQHRPLTWRQVLQRRDKRELG